MNTRDLRHVLTIVTVAACTLAAMAGDGPLERARAARNGLFGPGGSLAWLVAGTPEDSGEDLTVYDTPWQASAGPVESSMYVAPAGDDVAVDLDQDGTFTCEGYLRVVPESIIYAAGISGGGENVTVRHSGATFVYLSEGAPGYATSGASLQAFGMDLSAGTLSAVNEGDILVELVAPAATESVAAGIYAGRSGDISLDNEGTLFTSMALSGLEGGESCEAFGMLAEDADTMSLVNTGTVLTEVTAGSDALGSAGGLVWVNGMEGIGGNVTLENDGLLAAAASGAGVAGDGWVQVTGAWLGYGDSLVFRNGADGEIVAALEGTGDWVNADLFGVGFTVAGSATFENEGAITLVGPDGVGADSGPVFYGVSFVDCESVTVSNSGSITLDGAGEGTAFWFFNVDEALVDSPGQIDTGGDFYGLAVRQSDVTLADADGGAGSFGWTFGGDPETAVTPFYVGAGGTLDLNGATFRVYVGPGISWGASYPLFTMDGGTVEGTFGNIVSMNPDFTASWAETGGAAEAVRGDENDTAIVLGYEPQASQGVVAVHAGLTTFRHLLDTVVTGEAVGGVRERQLARAGGPVQVASARGYQGRRLSWAAHRTSGKATEVYVRPIEGGSLDADDLGYDADISGFRIGVRHRVNDRWTFGVFGGTGETDVDLDRGGTEDQDYDLYGAWVRLDWDRTWVFGGVSLASVDHDYAGWTGPGLATPERGTYDSDGLAVRLGAGRVYPLGEWNVVPAAELSWTSWTTDAHETTATDPAWNLDVREYDEDFADVALGADLLRTWAGSKDSVSVFLGVRAEQSLTGNEIEVVQSIPGLGTPWATVTQDVADFTLRAHAGLDWQRGGLHVAAGVAGRWNSDYDVVTGHLLLGYRF